MIIIIVVDTGVAAVVVVVVVIIIVELFIIVKVLTQQLWDNSKKQNEWQSVDKTRKWNCILYKANIVRIWCSSLKLSIFLSHFCDLTQHLLSLCTSSEVQELEICTPHLSGWLTRAQIMQTIAIIPHKACILESEQRVWP